ncbi:MAG: alpha/beta hydrolase [Polyangiaceae bacterium]
MTPAAAAGFLPHHSLVRAQGAEPSRWLVVLHGILGSGDNWRLFARKLCEKAPGWGVCLIDQRGHGQSQGAPPPHTLESAADDVLRLEAHLGLPVAAIAGHSFGGKVALTCILRRSSRLQHTFVLDSAPGVDGGSGGSGKVLDMLEGIAQPVASREAFVAEVTEHGFSREVADWLAMSVRRSGDGLRLRIDLAAARGMMEDYFARDLWRVVEGAVGTDTLDVVVGGRSDVLRPADRARLREIAARNPAVRVTVLENAGHWVHAEDPEGLLAVLASALLAPPSR